MKLFKMLFVVLSIFITNAALGFCLEVINKSNHIIRSAWADVMGKGCHDINAIFSDAQISQTYPLTWKTCADCPHQRFNKTVKLRIDNQNGDMLFDLDKTGSADRIRGQDIVMTVFDDHVLINNEHFYTIPDGTFIPAKYHK